MEKYGESLADTYENGKHFCSSIMFTSIDHDKPMPSKAPSWAKKIIEEDSKLRTPAN